jgi:hypothetical protein
MKFVIGPDQVYFQFLKALLYLKNKALAVKLLLAYRPWISYHPEDLYCLLSTADCHNSHTNYRGCGSPR